MFFVRVKKANKNPLQVFSLFTFEFVKMSFVIALVPLIINEESKAVKKKVNRKYRTC